VHGGQRTLIDLWVISQEVLRSAELRQPPRSFSRLRVKRGVQRNVRAVSADMWLTFGPEKAHTPPCDTSENGLCPAVRCYRSSWETAESLVLKRCPLSRTPPTRGRGWGRVDSLVEHVAWWTHYAEWIAARTGALRPASAGRLREGLQSAAADRRRFCPGALRRPL
jgi:hypothetical protein